MVGNTCELLAKKNIEKQQSTKTETSANESCFKIARNRLFCKNLSSERMKTAE